MVNDLDIGPAISTGYRQRLLRGLGKSSTSSISRSPRRLSIISTLSRQLDRFDNRSTTSSTSVRYLAPGLAPAAAQRGAPKRTRQNQTSKFKQDIQAPRRAKPSAGSRLADHQDPTRHLVHHTHHTHEGFARAPSFSAVLTPHPSLTLDRERATLGNRFLAYRKARRTCEADMMMCPLHQRRRRTALTVFPGVYHLLAIVFDDFMSLFCSRSHNLTSPILSANFFGFVYHDY
jgi:hypothetical protein